MTTDVAREGAGEEHSLCATAEDLASGSARVVIGILLRGHLDTQVVTPFELLHLPKPARVVLDGGLYVRAIERAAAVTPDGNTARRRDQLQAAIDETTRRARLARDAFATLPAGKDQLKRLLDSQTKQSPTGDPDLDVRHALAADLHERRRWAERIEFLAAIPDDERVRSPLDDVWGDVMGSDDALGVLFGVPNALPGDSLVRIANLAVLGDPGRAPTPAVAGLSEKFRAGALPVSRAMVVERTMRRLLDTTPLGRGSKAEEAAWVDALIRAFIGPDEVTGGDRMAEALTLRHARRQERGGAGAIRVSIATIAETRGDLVARLRYLAAVARRPIAARHLDEISRVIDAAIANELVIENLLANNPDVVELSRRVHSAAEEVRGTPMPDRERHAARILTVLDGPAKSGVLDRVLERVEPSTVRRASRLVELALSGLLSEAGGAPAARRAVGNLVRSAAFRRDLAVAQSAESGRESARRLQDLLDAMRREDVGSQIKAAPPTKTGISSAMTTARTAPPRGVGAASAAGDLCPHCLEPVHAGGGPCPACGFPDRVDNRPGLHLPPGVILRGRFRVGRPLGQGGFGTTYLGWDSNLGVKVAIKEFHPTGLAGRVPGSLTLAPHSSIHAETFSMGLGKFLDEARTLAALRDVREVVVIHDVFEENGTAYLVMELLRGRTLKAYVRARGGSLGVAEALRIAVPALRGVRAIHERGMVHRDISPDNIFLTVDGIPKLLDFGAARSFLQGDADLTVILKPGYAPPEQYSRTVAQGPWTDVYAMCATIYTILAGKPPVDAASRIHKDQLRSLRDLGLAVPPELDSAILCGLSMRPEDRPRDAAELAQLLSRVRIDGP